MYKEGIVECISFHEVLAWNNLIQSTPKVPHHPKFLHSGLPILPTSDLPTNHPSFPPFDLPTFQPSKLPISQNLLPKGQNILSLEGLRKNCGRYKFSNKIYTPVFSALPSNPFDKSNIGPSPLSVLGLFIIKQ